ncbi:MAG: nicotinate-nucleotide diphosphorylase (carboxylating) [Omnitrophica WOR_2 bacterium RIFCSPLOWO2_12_FULL_51_8]|nr:MAG: nicotinate-nucleotide diphosphorylase (carboxylating) [Omnitrophica WOR_2 bacterium RIFCSPLOWO2_12_FULL_51_8]
MPSNKHFLSEKKFGLDPEKVDRIVRQALIEDIGRGDITTALTIPKDKKVEAVFLAKEEFVACGLQVAERVFKIADQGIVFRPLAREGQKVKNGKVLARISGHAAGILAAERVALNLLSMLSAVATKTRQYVRKIEPCKTKITDTRKTLPGLRELQKYAVRVGGGYNHRMGLDEMILIKDNHIKVTDGLDRLPSVPKGLKIEIEAQNLEEFRHALRFKPDVIMLDNMSLADIKKAVKIRNNTEFKSHHPPTKLEVSGGVDLKNIERIASCGVEIISIGDLTHSIDSVDVSLEVI